MGTAISLVETGRHSYDLIQAFAAAGFLLVFSFPLGLGISLIVRSVFASWNVSKMLDSLRDSRGATPRLGAWVLFLLVAAAMLWIGTLQGFRILLLNTRVMALVVLVAPLLVLALCSLLLILSRPLVNFFESRMQSFETSRARQHKRAIITPKTLSLFAGSVLVFSLTFFWSYSLRPKIGYLDLGFVKYLVVFLVGILVFPFLWIRLANTNRGQGICAAFVSLVFVASISSASWTRYQRASSMLEIWGQPTTQGWAVDTIFNVPGLRSQLSIDGIEPTAIPGAKHPNIVLITIDTMRADRIPIYGGKAKMPTLTALSKKSAVFDSAFSPGNVTRRSLPALTIGVSPHRLTGRVVGWALRIDPRHVSLTERLRAAGYSTAGFFCCATHFARDRNLGLSRGMDHIGIDIDGAKLATNAASWLRDRPVTDAPVFLWAHFFEPHSWEQDYKKKPGSKSKGDRYDLSLKTADTNLKILLDGVRAELGEDTIIVVTSDHGEGLGDHKTKNHSVSLYDSEIRVPLLISGPGINPSRIQQVVGLVDLAPTLMELGGFEPVGMPQMDGLSIAPELLGLRESEIGTGEAYSVMVVDRSVEHSQSAIMSGHYKLIQNTKGTYSLYNRSNDPKEKDDIKASRPELFESMKARLERRRTIDRITPF